MDAEADEFRLGLLFLPLFAMLPASLSWRTTGKEGLAIFTEFLSGFVPADFSTGFLIVLMIPIQSMRLNSRGNRQ